MNERPNNRSMLERRLFVAGLAGAVTLPLAHAQSAATPAQTLGPFYPRSPAERPRDTDADLLTVDGDRVLTKGVPLYLTGRVVDRRGAALANAAVEIWQCDAHAVYHHPDGGSESQRDPAFQGYGVARTGAAGDFHFRTIRPVAYPGRTPHIHIRVQTSGGQVLATQLYLPNEAGNGSDFLFRRLNADEQAALTLRFGPASPGAHPLARATQQTARAELVVA
ncbi:MAG: intradiol ring-cleavage dioxygenase [Burkholderiaceae bacterium]